MSFCPTFFQVSNAMGSTERAGESHISHGHGSALSMMINEIAPKDGTGLEVAGYQKTTCELGNKHFVP